MSEETAQPSSTVMDVSSPIRHDDPALASFAYRTRSARGVLVVDLGFLGDRIHLIPALWELRRHYDRAELYLASTPQACEVIGLTGAMDRFWPVKLRPEQRSLAGQLRAIRSLRRHRFDVALNLTASDRSVILMGLVGARHRLAGGAGRRHAWYRWLVPHWLPQSEPGLPVFEQLRQALTCAGFRPGPKRFDLQIPDATLLLRPRPRRSVCRARRGRIPGGLVARDRPGSLPPAPGLVGCLSIRRYRAWPAVWACSKRLKSRT